VFVGMGRPPEDGPQGGAGIPGDQPPDGKLAGEPRGQFGKERQAVSEVRCVGRFECQSHSRLGGGPQDPARKSRVIQCGAEGSGRRRIVTSRDQPEIGQECSADLVGPAAEAEFVESCCCHGHVGPLGAGRRATQNAGEPFDIPAIDQFVHRTHPVRLQG
jgi:hypothetical protein